VWQRDYSSGGDEWSDQIEDELNEDPIVEGGDQVLADEDGFVDEDEDYVDGVLDFFPAICREYASHFETPEGRHSVK
jgi:hypothetical protein